MLVRPLRTNLKTTLEMTALFLHVTPSTTTNTLSIKAPTVRGRGEVGLWTGVRTLHSQLPASEIKQTSLSTSLASLLAFEW